MRKLEEYIENMEAIDYLYLDISFLDLIKNKVAADHKIFPSKGEIKSELIKFVDGMKAHRE